MEKSGYGTLFMHPPLPYGVGALTGDSLRNMRATKIPCLKTRHGTKYREYESEMSALGIVDQSLVTLVLLIKATLTIHDNIGLNAVVNGLAQLVDGILLFLD